MKKKSRPFQFKRGSKLAVSDDREGVIIAGNRQGLMSFANFISDVARLPYPKGDDALHHEHVGFKWFREVLKGDLRVHLGRKRLTAPTLKKAGSGPDVTIQISKNPWKYFYRRRRSR